MARNDCQPLLEVVQRVYAAATDPRAWPAALREIAELLGGVGPGLFLIDRSSGAPVLTVTSGLDPHYLQLHEAYYVSRDVRRPLVNALPSGALFIGQRLMPDRDFLRTEFYNDFLRPQSLFHLAGGVIMKDETHIGVFRILREKRKPAFCDADLVPLQALLPHLERAFHVHREVVAARQRRDNVAEVLDWIPTGIILLDRHGRVVARNRAARAIESARDGLTVVRGRLAATTKGETETLEKMVARELEGGSLGEAFVSIRRPSGLRSLMVVIVPLRLVPLLSMAGDAALAVFVTDPERRWDAPARVIASRLGVTMAEAALALALANGCSVREAAGVLRISENTARTQLKRALAKTGTHRQGELVRLVLTGVAQLESPPDDARIHVPARHGSDDGMPNEISDL